jgi:hypothetical protein
MPRYLISPHVRYPLRSTGEFLVTVDYEESTRRPGFCPKRARDLQPTFPKPRIQIVQLSIVAALKPRLVMIDDHRSAMLLEHFYFFNRHALSCVLLGQTQSLRRDAIIGVEEEEVAILDLGFGSLDPASPLTRPVGKA